MYFNLVKNKCVILFFLFMFNLCLQQLESALVISNDSEQSSHQCSVNAVKFRHFSSLRNKREEGKGNFQNLEFLIFLTFISFLLNRPSTSVSPQQLAYFNSLVNDPPDVIINFDHMYNSTTGTVLDRPAHGFNTLTTSQQYQFMINAMADTFNNSWVSDDMNAINQFYNNIESVVNNLNEQLEIYRQLQITSKNNTNCSESELKNLEQSIYNLENLLYSWLHLKSRVYPYTSVDTIILHTTESRPIVYHDCAFNLNLVKRPQSKNIPLNQLTYNDLTVRHYNVPSNEIPRGHQIQFARHHVIPWATIRDFFNLMMTDPATKNNACKILHNVMNDIIGTITGPSFTIDTITIPDLERNVIFQLMKSATPQTRRLLFQKQRTGNYQFYTNQIHQFFTWFTANIFVGPRDRADDPGSSFEINARYIINPNQYSLLRRAYDLMTSAINDINLTLDVYYDIANQVIILFHELLSYNEYTDYNPHDWMYVGRIGNRGIHTWKIFIDTETRIYEETTTEITTTEKQTHDELRKRSANLTEELRKKRIAVKDSCFYEDLKIPIKRTFNLMVKPTDRCL